MHLPRTVATVALAATAATALPGWRTTTKPKEEAAVPHSLPPAHEKRSERGGGGVRDEFYQGNSGPEKEGVYAQPGAPLVARSHLSGKIHYEDMEQPHADKLEYVPGRGYIVPRDLKGLPLPGQELVNGNPLDGDEFITKAKGGELARKQRSKTMIQLPDEDYVHGPHGDDDENYARGFRGYAHGAHDADDENFVRPAPEEDELLHRGNDGGITARWLPMPQKGYQGQQPGEPEMINFLNPFNGLRRGSGIATRDLPIPQKGYQGQQPGEELINIARPFNGIRRGSGITTRGLPIPQKGEETDLVYNGQPRGERLNIVYMGQPTQNENDEIKDLVYNGLPRGDGGLVARALPQVSGDEMVNLPLPLNNEETNIVYKGQPHGEEAIVHNGEPIGEEAIVYKGQPLGQVIDTIYKDQPQDFKAYNGHSGECLDIYTDAKGEYKSGLNVCM